MRPPLPGTLLLAATLLVSMRPAAAQVDPAKVNPAQVCPTLRSVVLAQGFPRAALELGLDRGDAVVEFTLDADSRIKDARVLRATHQIFGRAALRVVDELACHSPGTEIKVVLPLSYRTS